VLLRSLCQPRRVRRPGRRAIYNRPLAADAKPSHSGSETFVNPKWNHYHASSATGFPARSAGTKNFFHLARAFDAKESKRSSSLLEDPNIAHLAIRANDAYSVTCVDVGTNQFQRIAGV